MKVTLLITHEAPKSFTLYLNIQPKDFCHKLFLFMTFLPPSYLLDQTDKLPDE